MNFEEHAGKRLLAEAGIATPKGRLALTPEEARAAARQIGPVLVQGMTGRQGTFWTDKMIASGANVISGDNPKEGGSEIGREWGRVEVVD